MKKIAFIGGGSGGHIMPIVAIYNALKADAGLSFVWIGEKGAMDEAKAKEHGIPFRGIVSDKLRRYFSFRSLIAPFKILFGFFQAIGVFLQEKPDVVFSKGGPVSFPVGLAAWVLRIPLSLHESDTVPGLANRVSAKFASKVFLWFESAKKYFDAKKVEVIGQIMDPVFTEYLGQADASQLPVGKRTKAVVLCGSQGSTIVFEALLDILGLFPDIDFTIALGTLNTHFRARFEKFPNVTVYDWIGHGDLARIYFESDIAITRSAATSLAEMQAFGIRMIMVPLGISSYYHQYYNAVEWCEKYPGHAMLEEKDLARLADTLLSFRNYKKSALPTEGGMGAVDRVWEYLHSF